MKTVKWSAIFTALLYVVAGVLLFLYPYTETSFVCEILGIGCLAVGVILIVFYLLMDVQTAFFRNDFLEGVILMLLGGVVLYQLRVVEPLVPLILAIVIAGSGVKKIQDAIDLGRLGYGRTLIYVVLAILSIGVAVVVLLGVIQDRILQNQIIGAGLAYSGATDLFSAIYLSGKIRGFLKEEATPVVKVEEKKEEKKEEPVEPEPVIEEDRSPIINTIQIDEEYDDVDASTKIPVEEVHGASQEEILVDPTALRKGGE